jgi:CheY-like chemotaxis protein
MRAQPAGEDDKRLLIVDDNTELCDAIREIAQAVGYEVAVTYDGNAFMERFASFRPDHIILDLAIPGPAGLELLRFLAGERCDAEITVASSHNETVLEQAMKLGAHYGLKMGAVLQKPFTRAELENVLQ